MSGSDSVLAQLMAVIEDRKAHPPERSYTNALLAGGVEKIGGKIREEALEVANGTEFGLGANAWTNDDGERRLLIRDLAAGMVFINGNVTSYPQLPFGGIRHSGFGRELSRQGIHEFCNIKSVWIGA